MSPIVTAVETTKVSGVFPGRQWRIRGVPAANLGNPISPLHWLDKRVNTARRPRYEPGRMGILLGGPVV